MGEDFGATLRLGPEFQFQWSPAEDFGAGISGEASETVVYVEVGAVGKNVDGKTVGTRTERRREEMLGVGEGAFGLEKFFGDAALFAIGEDQANGGAEKGSSDGDPCERKLIAGQGAAHEEDQHGYDNREAVGDSEIAEGGDRLSDGAAGRAVPGRGKENHAEAGKEKQKVSPAGSIERGFQGEQIVRI